MIKTIKKWCYFALSFAAAIGTALAVPIAASAYVAGPCQTEGPIPNGVTQEQS